NAGPGRRVGRRRGSEGGQVAADHLLGVGPGELAAEPILGERERRATAEAPARPVRHADEAQVRAHGVRKRVDVAARVERAEHVLDLGKGEWTLGELSACGIQKWSD